MTDKEIPKRVAVCAECGTPLQQFGGDNSAWFHIMWNEDGWNHDPQPQMDTAQTMLEGDESEKHTGTWDSDDAVRQMKAIRQALEKVYGIEFWPAAEEKARNWRRLLKVEEDKKVGDNGKGTDTVGG